jgi:hypothetical protein
LYDALGMLSEDDAVGVCVLQVAECFLEFGVSEVVPLTGLDEVVVAFFAVVVEVGMDEADEEGEEVVVYVWEGLFGCGGLLGDGEGGGVGGG